MLRFTKTKGTLAATALGLALAGAAFADPVEDELVIEA